MLVRKLLSDRLSRYYAQPAHAVVGSVQYNPSLHDTRSGTRSSIPFSRLWGEFHWKRLYQRLYKEQQGQWLTPVELFQPYYSNAIGSFIAETACSGDATDDSGCGCGGIHIIEIGGGRGTSARLILDFLQKNHPRLYQSCHYTIIDSSPTLHELQKEVLFSTRNNSDNEHHSRDKVSFKLLDLISVAEEEENTSKQLLLSNTLSALPSSSKPRTVVLALEVLDNLPHDKVRVRLGKGGEKVVEQGEILHTKNNDHDSGSTLSLQEVFRPLSDPLLEKILTIAPWYAPPSSSSTLSQPTWVPSVACGTLLQLARMATTTTTPVTMLLADFDWLPPPDRFDPSTFDTTGCSTMLSASYVSGEGEPLVTCMDGYDFPSYLHPPEDKLCDILFPTNFAKLAAFCRAIFPSSGTNGTTTNNNRDTLVNVYKQSNFLRHYGGDEMEQTKSWLTGYSPLLHDFSNCSVLTVVTR